MMYSINEWDPLKSVVVGSATNAHWPVSCPDFRKLEQTTKWKQTPVPSGPVDQQIVDEANEDLNYFAFELEQLGIEVLRPTDMDFASFDGMYNYCPRDRLLVVGDTVIDAPMAYGCRDREIEALECVTNRAGQVIPCLEPGVRFDAANICRLGQDLLYLVSESGNLSGAKWLQDVLGKEYRVHPVNFYAGVHIDSTISPIREGLVVLNASRVNEDNIPDVLRSWDKIWINEGQIQPQGFVSYPYASAWIGLNFLTINPNLIVCDPAQYELRTQLRKHRVESLGVNLRHSRTLGGGHHCVTLDIARS